jgi:hypothetical protein
MAAAATHWAGLVAAATAGRRHLDAALVLRDPDASIEAAIAGTVAPALGDATDGAELNGPTGGGWVPLPNTSDIFEADVTGVDPVVVAAMRESVERVIGLSLYETLALSSPTFDVDGGASASGAAIAAAVRSGFNMLFGGFFGASDASVNNVVSGGASASATSAVVEFVAGTHMHHVLPIVAATRLAIGIAEGAAGPVPLPLGVSTSPDAVAARASLIRLLRLRHGRLDRNLRRGVFVSLVAGGSGSADASVGNRTGDGLRPSRAAGNTAASVELGASMTAGEAEEVLLDRCLGPASGDAVLCGEQGAGALRRVVTRVTPAEAGGLPLSDARAISLVGMAGAVDLMRTGSRTIGASPSSSAVSSATQPPSSSPSPTFASPISSPGAAAAVDGGAFALIAAMEGYTGAFQVALVRSAAHEASM